MFQKKLLLPQSWISLDLDERKFDTHYAQQVFLHGTPQTIEEWGNRVDQMIQASYLNKQVMQGIPTQNPWGKNFWVGVSHQGLLLFHRLNLHIKLDLVITNPLMKSTRWQE